MPPLREKNRLWASIAPPSNASQPPCSSQSLVPTDRHSTSLRLLFKDTERLLQDFSSQHEKLLAGTSDALKSMTGLDEALLSSRQEAVAEIKNIASLQHLSLREQLNEIGSAVTGLSEGCGKIKETLNGLDEVLGRRIADTLEVFHKRLDDMGEKQEFILETVKDIKHQLDSEVLPALPKLDDLPSLLDGIFEKRDEAAQTTRNDLMSKLDELRALVRPSQRLPIPLVSESVSSSLPFNAQSASPTPVSVRNRVPYTQDCSSPSSSPTRVLPSLSSSPISCHPRGKVSEINALRDTLSHLTVASRSPPESRRPRAVSHRSERPIPPAPKDGFTEALSQLYTAPTSRELLSSLPSLSSFPWSSSQLAPSLSSSSSLPSTDSQISSLEDSPPSSYLRDRGDMPNVRVPQRRKLNLPNTHMQTSPKTFKINQHQDLQKDRDSAGPGLDYIRGSSETRMLLVDPEEEIDFDWGDDNDMEWD
ncbi:hypothetical protein DACRYDRAFT_104783 [Dacryopinax primogenitus]|uniref:Uncharacterized protein n=1 Tax=Dacryopinax primogenitus (strain DJM 731) TaxID=1858805 RepID=M5G803_DACPD|nr:uncharacterized protein DACRYDRAFT_104783 [Dacryopinax primogenitus]EJU04889.1 hypothetical protein DACRYDRAFT_104783 [Dacryopinax primogenitus]